MKMYFWRTHFTAFVRKGFPRTTIGTGLAMMLLLWPCSRAVAGGTVSACSQANLTAAMSGGGVVTFACNGEILLTNTIAVSSNVILNAAGHDVTISGGNRVRLFNVNAGASLSLVGLRLANGSNTIGGAILNNGTLNVTNSTFNGNQAAGANGTNGLSGQAGFDAAGGAIWNAGRLNVSGSRFFANAVRGGNGGTGSNQGGDGGAGGRAGVAWGAAIFNQGLAQVDMTAFESNGARGGAGGSGGTGARTDNPLQSAHSGGSGGTGGAAAGGAIYNGTNGLTVTRSLFASNSAAGGMGGAGGSGNTGFDTLGGNGSAGGAGGVGSGGAICDQGGGAAITNSTFAANLTLGGSGAAGGNGAECTGGRGGGNAGGGGSGGDATGGALAAPASAAVILSHDTLSGNSAIPGNAGHNGAPGSHCSSTGGGLVLNPGTNGISAGGALYSAVSTGVIHFSLENSILAGSISGGNCSGSVLDAGHNISSDATCQFSTRSTSLNNTDAKLAPLAGNGGATATFALLDGSPAINAINTLSSSAPTDQRGVLRPQGGQSDIGAYEYSTATIAVKPAGALHLVFSSVANLPCSLESSANFVVWEPQPALMTATNGIVTFEVAAPNSSARFFRTVTTP